MEISSVISARVEIWIATLTQHLRKLSYSVLLQTLLKEWLTLATDRYVTSALHNYDTN